MEIGTVLILAGTTVAAGLAIIAAYTLAARQRSIQKKSNGSSSSLVTTVETRAEPISTEGGQQEPVNVEAQTRTNVPISEAPPPFPEEETKSPTVQIPSQISGIPSSAFALPTDSTAVGSIGPKVVVIPTPKKKPRARRLPSANTGSRRKKASKTASIPASTDIQSPISTTFEQKQEG